MKVRCSDRTQVTFANGLVGSCCEHHEIDDVSAGNRVVVAESGKPAPFKRTNVATQQLHGVGLSPKTLQAVDAELRAIEALARDGVEE